MRKRTHLTAFLFVIAFGMTAVFGVLAPDATPGEYFFGQVGVGAGVAANEFNTIAQGLQEWGSNLEEREKILEQQETLLVEQAERAGGVSREAFFALAVVTSVLGGLVVANFYMDWRRRR